MQRRHFLKSKEMTMCTPHHFPISIWIHRLIPWVLKLASRMLARGLDVPEPMLHHTGMFVFARVAAFEGSIGRSLGAGNLLRLFHRRRGGRIGRSRP
jgi:hypothetical protein